MLAYLDLKIGKLDKMTQECLVILRMKGETFVAQYSLSVANCHFPGICKTTLSYAYSP